MATKKETRKKFNKYAVTFGNQNGSMDSLFFSTLKEAKECKSSIGRDWKECYFEKIDANGVDYYKI